MIPSMGGTEIAFSLFGYASRVKPGHCIVEVGSWLGAGTVHLASGASHAGASLHCFDRWRCSKTESEKAALAGVILREGDDLLPHIRKALSAFRTVAFHKGEIASAKWDGQPIGLYVDDASKAPSLWAHSMTTFRPFFVSGSIMILMDYHFDEVAGPAYKAQKEYMREHDGEFEMIEAHVAGTSAAIFRVC